MSKETYWLKYRFCDRQILEPVKEKTKLIVVIPCYNEPDLVSSLEAIAACEQPKSEVEVIVVVNASEKASEYVIKQNELTFEQFENFRISQKQDWITFHCINQNALPKKHAGVGLARKIGMDEAVLRFSDINEEEGVVVCFDADSSCKSNYLVEIEKHFEKHPKTPGCSIKYEHPHSGNEYSSEIYSAIIDYELFLRYYKNAFQYTGHPYYYYTVGSSMAVKKWAYEKQGGMNRKKACLLYTSPSPRDA